MGLFDDYFDPDQFQDSGGLYGRLLSTRPDLAFQSGGADASNVLDGSAPSAQQTSFQPTVSQRAFNDEQASSVAAAPARSAATPTASGPAQDLVAQNNSRMPPSSGVEESGPTPPFERPLTTNVGYVAVPMQSNQAFGELMGIQGKREDDVISGEDFVSGVREGDVKHNQEDGSLDVRNGTIVSLSYRDGRSRVITVTDPHIAHVDKTGKVTIGEGL